ncbi:hypothetical protein A5672_19455 [Mycobacterium alsense]|uniref:PPE family protein n=1 Tax=Mycobacterium alsense TaxID=324058 RepID=A0ABD6P275_9MYCO|nr:PPE family protein [Mycobacterium alsense]OBG36766.1 hypothetical protein A5672_19455 [Mycobacterium alsense]
MDFATLPPEINSGRMYAGSGAGPMLAAAAAWDGLAAQLHSTAGSYRSVVSGLISGPWLGPASAAMAAAAGPYAAWITATAEQAEQAATQAGAAAAVYEAAFAMTVPPPVIAANRSLLVALVSTNIFGQNTTAIAATEAHYAEMWAQDAAAMYGYAGSSAAAANLTPFTLPPPTTSAAAPAQAIMSSGLQLMSMLPQALQGLAKSAAATSTVAALLGPGTSALSSLGTALTALAIPVAGIDTVAAGIAAPASVFSGSASSVSATTTVRALRINADRDFARGEGPFIGDGPGAAMLPQWIAGGAGGVGEPSTASAQLVAADMGRGASVGGLSVPSGWVSAAPEVRPVAYALPIMGAEAAPEIGSAANLFSGMGLAGLAGGAVGSAASPRRGGERVRVANRENQKPPRDGQRPQDGPVAEIAAELGELAVRAQSLLAKLQEYDPTEGQVREQHFLSY